MNKKFPIRTVGLMLLEKIYLGLDNNFKTTIDVNEIINEKINMNMIQQSAKYLKERNYIQYDVIPCDKWTVTMTALGIDWLEICYNIDPTKSIKE